MAIKGVPSSITEEARLSTSTRTISLAINPLREEWNNNTPWEYTLANGEITTGQVFATRRIVQKDDTAVFYEFLYPPVQIQYEGITPEFVEIQRPLLQPMVEKRTNRNYRAQFEFLVSNQFDGLTFDVEEQLKVLEYMANSGKVVYFENFDNFLTFGFWHIAEFQVQTSRVNTDGKITAAQCSMGLLEYLPPTDRTRFAGLPRITYGKTKRPPKKGSGQDGPKFSCKESDILLGICQNVLPSPFIPRDRIQRR